MTDFEKMSDRELFLICKKYGAEALAARRRFAGLLPEVHRRELAANEKGASWLQKRGFTCLYEFAARLAGMSRDQVDLIVRTDRRLEDKPILRQSLVSGAVSVNKLARVVSIVTVENQGEILRKASVLSNRALEVFVKDFKNMNGLSEPQNSQTAVHVQVMRESQGSALMSSNVLRLDEDVAKELLDMQSGNLDVNGLIREFLRKRKEKLERETQEAAQKQDRAREERAVIGYPAKRYIPAEVRKIVYETFGGRCGKPGCMKRAENLHHEKGFMKDQCHNPRFLKPLCRGHHELAHYG